MGALRFVGLAMMTAVAPIAVLIGSSPAHAGPPNIGDPCSVDGAHSRAADGTLLLCQRPTHGAPLQWMGVSLPGGVVPGG
jgi:hypothetical protein